MQYLPAPSLPPSLPLFLPPSMSTSASVTVYPGSIDLSLDLCIVLTCVCANSLDLAQVTIVVGANGCPLFVGSQ